MFAMDGDATLALVPFLVFNDSLVVDCFDFAPFVSLVLL